MLLGLQIAAAKSLNNSTYGYSAVSRSLAELGYIDSNLTGKHLMVWVESVTGYEDGDAPHFTKAYKDATPQDTNVVDFRGQIEQMLA